MSLCPAARRARPPERHDCSRRSRPARTCSRWCTTPRTWTSVRRRADASWGVGHGLRHRPTTRSSRGMYDASALIAGGSVLAARAGLGGPSPARGEHRRRPAPRDARRAPPGSASSTTRRSPSPGCCALGAERIAYVDVDVHHGDGVQAAFYDDPRVLTVSVHQTPLTLFPGTGFPDETGDGDAAGQRGQPRAARGTDDAGWLRAFHAVVPAVLRAFRPQVLVTQCGCDTHHEDPLAELALTVDGQRSSLRGPAPAGARALRRQVGRARRRRVRPGALRAAGLDAPARRGERATGSTRPPRSRRPGGTTSRARGLRAPAADAHDRGAAYTGVRRRGSPVDRDPRRPRDQRDPAGRVPAARTGPGRSA